MTNQLLNPQEAIERILVDEAQIDEITTRVAAEIDAQYANSGKRLLLLGILKGSVIFMSDLMKKIKTPVEIDFMKVSSYGAGTVSRGNVNIILDLHRKDLHELDIIIVEDIIDSGRTLSHLIDYLRLRGANSVRCCTMLDKPDRRDESLKNFEPDFLGIKIPDEFVVGYGLDYDEQFRALPYVGILKRSVYSE